jgi:telomere length regulation protein
MSNLWTVVSDGHCGENSSRPQAQLQAVQTRNPSAEISKRVVDTTSPTPFPSKSAEIPPSSIDRPEDALQLLRSEPDTDSLLSTLKRVSSIDGFKDAFDIRRPSPLAAQIINTIVSSITPNFWSALEKQDRRLITTCISNVAGLNSVMAKIQLLISQSKSSKAQDYAQTLEDLFSVADDLFQGDHLACMVWTGLQESTVDKTKRDLAWKECSNLLGSGKVSNVMAEAEDILRSGGSKVSKSPVANSHVYAILLGSTIAQILITGNETHEEVQTHVAVLLSRALGLGQPTPLMKALHTKLVQNSDDDDQRAFERFVAVSGSLPTFSKRRYLDYTLRWLSGIEPSAPGQDPMQSTPAKEVAAITALVQAIVKNDVILQQHIAALLADPALVSSLSFITMRASVATLVAVAPDDLDDLVEKGLETFGDQMFVRHSPILEQESLAQTLLITAGYLHRRSPMALLMSVRSSGHMQGVSNRLDASNSRARWLGMVVGTALSSLVDKEGSKLSFGTEDMQTPEAKRYMDLVKIDDKASTLDDFSRLVADTDKKRRAKIHKPVSPRQIMPKIDGKPTYGPVRPPTKVQTEVEGDKVAEISDADSDDDDGLTPYAKPDSDAEDSDEDATLVNRDKSRAPVYVRDLMTMLQDSEKHDRFTLGLKHAAPLIRRKTNFGREVTDHAEELARILCSLQDPFDTDNFEELRLQALIAVVMSDPSAIAPWLSRQAFAGEFSIAQRCTMLTALGLSGRELAGLKEQDNLNPNLPDSSFPSKRLPPHLHAIYNPQSSISKTKTNSSIKRLDAAHSTLETALLRPIALSAADTSTSHLNAVKARSFSSRMAVQRTKRKPAPNKLAQIFPEAFFYPLVNRFQQDVAAYGSASLWTITPFLLVTLLKTLALLFHAAGPATLGLLELSAEFWDLLLSLRVKAVGHISVLGALLFGILTVLEANAENPQGVVQGLGRQLTETQQWADMVFERTGQSRMGMVQQEGQGEEAKVRSLAAAVLVKTGEVMEAQRRVLMGDMMES